MDKKTNKTKLLSHRAYILVGDTDKNLSQYIYNKNQKKKKAQNKRIQKGGLINW